MVFLFAALREKMLPLCECISSVLADVSCVFQQCQGTTAELQAPLLLLLSLSHADVQHRTLAISGDHKSN